MRPIVLSLLTLLTLFSLSAQDYQDVSALMGIDHTFEDLDGVFAGGTSFVDFNNDGWDDISFASHLGDSLYFYQNNSGTSFTRVFFAGLETTCHAKQIMWVDIENDGDNDFFAACHTQANHFFKNTGNMVFEDATMQSGLDTIAEFTFGCSFGDIDNDGDMDLAFFNRAVLDDRNIILYENLGNATFSDITQSAGVEDIPVGPFCGTFMDYNTDGYVDLYIAQDKYFGNVLFKNEGDKTFTNANAATGLGHELDAMCIAPGDYDNDDDIDIYVTNTPLEGNHLFQNNGNGTYTDIADGQDIRVYGFDWGANFFDVENDGDLDLYVSGIYTDGSTENSWLLHNDGLGNLTFANPGMLNDNHQSYSNAIGDYNNDGYPDIAVNNYNMTPSKLWKNTNGENETGDNWIKIQLQGVQSNIEGYGSKFEVYAGGNKQLRYSYCGEGFIAQNASCEIFGVGTSIIVDSIVITWLSGIVDVLYAQNINQELLIIEGSTLTTGLSDAISIISEFQADLNGHIHFSLGDYNAPSFRADILMIDGRKLISREYQFVPGHHYAMNMSNHPAGVYVFRISVGNQNWSETFVIK